MEEGTLMFAKHYLHYMMGLSLFATLSLNAVELPEMLPSTAAPEIISFTLYRPAEDDNGSYTLSWETRNTTKVIISTIGKVPSTGTQDVTSNDPGVEEIVLTASNNDDFQPVTETIYLKKPEPMSFEPSTERQVDDMPPTPMRRIVPGRRVRPYRY